MWMRTLARCWSRTWRQCGRDAVEERLAADEAVVGEQVGAVGEMLTRAEADFEMERAVVAEQPPRGQLALIRHRDLREQTFRPARPADARNLCPLERP